MPRVFGAASRGLTLVELMLVLAVAALLLAVGAPSFASMLREHRLTVFANELHAAIWLARSEAIRRGHRVTLCASQDGVQCTAGATWDAGWIMFPDPNNNASRDPGETLIRARNAGFQGVAVRGNASLARYVSYLPGGTSRTVNGALQMGTIRICNGTHQRSLVMNAVGRVRVERSNACD